MLSMLLSYTKVVDTMMQATPFSTHAYCESSISCPCVCLMQGDEAVSHKNVRQVGINLCIFHDRWRTTAYSIIAWLQTVFGQCQSYSSIPTNNNPICLFSCTGDTWDFFLFDRLEPGNTKLLLLHCSFHYLDIEVKQRKDRHAWKISPRQFYFPNRL